MSWRELRKTPSETSDLRQMSRRGKKLYDVDGQQLCEACLNGTSDDGITPIDPECIPFY